MLYCWTVIIDAFVFFILMLQLAKEELKFNTEYCQKMQY